MSLRNLDLNLLVTLDALLEERNVTRAAGRLSLSQPAVSTALQRLRRHFGDELLARDGNRYELTPLAQQLREPTASALAGVERVFGASTTFDPETATREFTVIVSDYAAAVLGDRLATVTAERAPGVRLRLKAQSHFDVNHAPESLRSADGMVLPHGFLTDVPSQDLYEDSWVLVVSRDNALVGDVVTLEDLGQMPWVMTHHQPTAFTPAARQLSMIGIEPEIQVVVESFLPVPFLVAGTPRVALLQHHLASKLSDAAGVRVLDCPWDVVPLVEAFWWHPVHRSDPAHAWLRDTLIEAGRLVTGDPS
ncbi:LysR family transcriptional regulator [Nocardioides sp. NPDC006303]|uniref:LysR family transcriptional regulator n=1 Tax=Nocardioides sp. NPDC006303 TaxID=3156747 RepID=UPI0033BF02A4